MKILVVDDDEVTRKLLKEVLEKEKYTVSIAASGEAALGLLNKENFPIILSDIRMLEVDGLTILRQVKKRGSHSVVILMTGFGSLEGALDAIREGAFDYVSKPFKLNALKAVLKRAVIHLESLETQTFRGPSCGQINLPSRTVIGKSPQMVEVFKTLARASLSSSNVLIRGERGVGKELLARAIHENSSRDKGLFLVLDCKSLADLDVVFENSKAETLFFDEVGELSLPLQLQFLRILDASKATVFPRVISTTTMDLESQLKAGKFREDLYYQLNVISLEVPPLRERVEDLPSLIEYFIAWFSEKSKKPISHVAEDALKMLSVYPWPGNIRELERAIEHAVAMASSRILFGEDFPTEIQHWKSGVGVLKGSFLLNASSSSSDEAPSLELLERTHILKILQHVGFNKSKAAELLGIDRATLYRKAVKFEINLRGLSEISK